MEPQPIDFRPGHACRVVYTRNDELIELHCECSTEPVRLFEYPSAPLPDASRPHIDEVRAAVDAHYAELDVA